MPWLRRVAFAAAGDDSWEQRAAQLLAEDLSRAHRRLVMAVLGQDGASADPVGATRRMMQEQAAAVERLAEVIDEIKSGDGTGLAAATVAVRELSTLSERVYRGRPNG